MLLPRVPRVPTCAMINFPSCMKEGNGPVLAHVTEKTSFPAIHDEGDEP